MSVLETPHNSSAIHAPVLASESTQTGNFWASGPSELSLVESPTTAEALSLSLFLALRPQWPERREPAEVESSQGQEAAGRKRKMSNREDPFFHQEQQPKRRRDTESLGQPQFVAPHELTTSSGQPHSYPPPPPPPPPHTEPRTMRRHGSSPSGYDQARSMETGQHYSPAPYLQPPESDWSGSMHRERPVLPSLASTQGYGHRMSPSYSMAPIASNYAPAGIGQVQYSRSDSYSYGRSGYEIQPTQQQTVSQQAFMQGVDPQQRQPPTEVEQDPKGKPRCWDHGCAGRQFSTFSNLLRHQRERAGVAQKSYCPSCGAEFTRKTARDGHFAHGKCKQVRRSPDPSQGSGSGHGNSPYGGAKSNMPGQ